MRNDIAAAGKPPSDTIGIRGDITIFNVEPKKTISIFIFSMTISANGRIETVTHPGPEVATNFGGSPGRATLLTRGQLTALLSHFEAAKKGGGSNADQTAKNSDFRTKTPARAPESTERRVTNSALTLAPKPQSERTNRHRPHGRRRCRSLAATSAGHQRRHNDLGGHLQDVISGLVVNNGQPL